MFIEDFDKFVRASDQSTGKVKEERLDIAIYGLSAEIGSVVAAVKKRLLAEDGPHLWNEPNSEIIEELGDVIWYSFALAHVLRLQKPISVFSASIARLKREVMQAGERGERVRGIFSTASQASFLHAVSHLPRSSRRMKFDDYQRVAFLTARTEGRTLVEVCLAVLLQLSAQLFRHKLPAVAKELNKTLEDCGVPELLGDLAWHIACLASIYGVTLSEIIATNMEKVSFRLDKSNPTPLHDSLDPSAEQFPRRFEIQFVTYSKGRSRMYFMDKQLGDDLSDNTYHDDGYRYHDIMHLANAAKLGWSPVLRGLMGLKRKSQPHKDEVEDGARAKIVEEAVVKTIHSEGQRIARLGGRAGSEEPARLFQSSQDITFRFLKLIQSLVIDVEVYKNRYWEWEAAILSGYQIFHELRLEGQGSVVVDLDERSIKFSRDVCIQGATQVVGLGSAALGLEAFTQDKRFAYQPLADDRSQHEEAVQKMAILTALGFSQPLKKDVEAIRLTSVANKGISVKSTGHLQQAIWNKEIVGFRTTITEVAPNSLYCTALLMRG